MKSIYLDYQSTTPMAGSVREAMLPFLGEHFADPSSDHWMGRACQEAIEDARSCLATLIGCHPSEIVFTSGGTESNNLALLGAASQLARSLPLESGSSGVDRPHMIISAMEHMAVSKSAEWLQRHGWQVTRVGCDAQGSVSVDRVESALRPNTKMISVMHANHEVGTIQPIREISELCIGREVVLHTDACQSVGKIPVDVETLAVDLLSLTGHKMYGPKGIGALYVRNGVAIDPLLQGDWQEGGLRPGMENVSHIVGLGQAARLASQGLQEAADRLAMLRERLLDRLEQLLRKNLVVHGAKAERLPGTLSLVLPNCSAMDVLKRVPELCTGPLGHDGHPNSYLGMAPTLAAMGVDPSIAHATVRLSVGWNTTEDEVDRAADLLAEAIESCAR
jgi:cysteine desulfurase